MTADVIPKPRKINIITSRRVCSNRISLSRPVRYTITVRCRVIIVIRRYQNDCGAPRSSTRNQQQCYFRCTNASFPSTLQSVVAAAAPSASASGFEKAHRRPTVKRRSSALAYALNIETGTSRKVSDRRSEITISEYTITLRVPPYYSFIKIGVPD
ncbi:hypothetical protein QTP88_019499 [Uroleucon formosanum]